ncbi:MAG: dihydroorotase, partial [Candidatus Cloacimonetes bacterium]|nr:dihydroorotase [Candidatus Cloacimonadota bacterium]
MPDVYDFHVHIGEVIGGNQLAHDWKSLNKICQEEGIKGIGAFVTEEASARLIDKYSAMLAESKRYFQGRVHWHLSPTHSSLEELLPLLVGGCDLKFYTTYEAAGLYTSYQRIGEWMQDLKSVSALQESGLPRLLIHCEDNGIIRECSARHPFKHPWDHTLRRPEKAENIAVERILELALEHQYPVHIVHVSSPQSALLIHQAKQNSSS